MERLKKWDPKDPEDEADYWFDFTRLIGDPLREITSADLDVPLPVTNPDDDFDFLGQIVRVRLAGGLAPVDYPVICDVILDNNEKFRMESKLKVRKRIK